MAPKENFDADIDDSALDAMRPGPARVSSDDMPAQYTPIGISKVGRVSANAGQEGAQAVYEQRAHHTGRIEDADVGPDYTGAIRVNGT